MPSALREMHNFSVYKNLKLLCSPLSRNPVLNANQQASLSNHFLDIDDAAVILVVVGLARLAVLGDESIVEVI